MKIEQNILPEDINSKDYRSIQNAAYFYTIDVILDFGHFQIYLLLI